MFNGGYLAKFLRPDVVARAGIVAWSGSQAVYRGPLLRLVPNSPDPNIRAYRTSDLDRCAK